MTKATSFEEWSAALGRQTMPLLNAVYAVHQGTTCRHLNQHMLTSPATLTTATGNIFYGYNALLPQNRSSVDHDWSAPVPGTSHTTAHTTAHTDRG